MFPASSSFHSCHSGQTVILNPYIGIICFKMLILTSVSIFLRERVWDLSLGLRGLEGWLSCSEYSWVPLSAPMWSGSQMPVTPVDPTHSEGLHGYLAHGAYIHTHAYIYISKSIKIRPAGWYTLLIPALGTQRQVWVQVQPGQYS